MQPGGIDEKGPGEGGGEVFCRFLNQELKIKYFVMVLSLVTKKLFNVILF